MIAGRASPFTWSTGRPLIMLMFDAEKRCSSSVDNGAKTGGRGSSGIGTRRGIAGGKFAERWLRRAGASSVSESDTSDELSPSSISCGAATVRVRRRPRPRRRSPRPSSSSVSESVPAPSVASEAVFASDPSVSAVRPLRLRPLRERLVRALPSTVAASSDTDSSVSPTAPSVSEAASVVTSLPRPRRPRPRRVRWLRDLAVSASSDGAVSLVSETKGASTTMVFSMARRRPRVR